MRSFIVSCSLLICVCLFLAVNMFVISSDIKEITSLCENLPGTPEEFEKSQDTVENFKKLKENFESHLFYMELSVGHTFTEKSKDALTDIESALQCENAADFISAKNKFIMSVDDIKIAEGLRLDRFF